MMVCPHCSQRVTKGHFCLQMLKGMPIGPRVGRRILAIGAAEKARAKEIIAYSEAHPKGPDAVPMPGDMPEHVMLVPMGIRCVYSHLILDCQTYRYLSISLLDAPDRTVAPEITIMICKELFLFDGLLPEWSVDLPDEPPPTPQIVAIAQLARAAEGRA